MKFSTSAKFHIYFTLCACFCFSAISNDTLTSSQSLVYNQTLVSPKNVFEFGFFNTTPSKWYIGTWYKDFPDKTYVWVANRDTPLQNSNGTLKIQDDGSLVLLNQTNSIVWSSNQTVSSVSNPVLNLLDDGNLILKEEQEKNYIWQSFDHPTDTLLPGMKLGWNLDTGVEIRVTSWKSQDDPSTGDCYFNLDYHGVINVYLWNKQQRVFGGVPILSTIAGLNDKIVADDHQAYYYPEGLLQSNLSRLVVNWTCSIERYAWIGTTKSWNKLWYAPEVECDYYGACGPFGICDSNAFPRCECVTGFAVKNQRQWDLRNFSDGCVRKTKLECGKDKFLHLKDVQLPDTRNVFVNKSMTLLECENMCLEDCSCTAYANEVITNGGTGCVMWNQSLVDLRQFNDAGQDLFIRLASSDVGK
ncbi:S-locus-specific glycoprotein S13-like [Vicia villosa]|uniref:S-locus-specific glycoprotein S13-like n=1 Tax=Vicia villosa TaxID=3911 RepID=UPI00273BFFC3|nr:S-locus-specific glycoprotein S13-like [Vicia villosa]